VTAWAETYEDGEQLALKIKYALQRYKGVVGDMVVTGIVFLNDTYVYDPETGRETFPADYKLNYMEE